LSLGKRFFKGDVEEKVYTTGNMGRKKIQISRITDERNRQVTFNKRKFGVMKKAYELSVLCDCEIALIIFSSSNKLYQYASTDMDKVLLKYTEYNEPHESLTNKNIIEKETKNGTMSPESPEPEDNYTLTPRTEAKYNKIDEDFQLMMQRNQQLAAAGARVRFLDVNMSGGNYNLPVSVPVAGTYVEGSMLQTSPPLTHQISPRPSSSETDSEQFTVYPSGAMLEMSNGYPHSASPMGGSPSPGPSPSIGGHHMNKSHQVLHKQHSPGGQSGRNANLRVVIPSQMTSGLSSDDNPYSEHNRQSQNNLNASVVALQTPIPGLTSYQLGTFGAQDFSMSSTDLSMLTSGWNSSQHNLTAVQHANYFPCFSLPHLAVSNSTPPPATSPVPVKIKTERVSPTRDVMVSNHQGISSLSSSQPTISSINLVSHANTATLGTLSHGSQQQQQQQHMLSTGRPSSTGHLTPTPGALLDFLKAMHAKNQQF